MKKNKILFLIMGVIMFLNAVIVNGTYIIEKKFPEGLLFMPSQLCVFA